jgi:replication factor C subunit 2/4
MVRNKIKPFCKRSTTPFQRNGHVIDYKFVILDEADTLTKDAQNALRRCIEIYSYNTRFCFMCNYVCNIITPILSRCSVCHFRPVIKPIAILFLKGVCNREGVQCSDPDLELIYDTKHGDLRACLTALQSAHQMTCGQITNAVLRDHLQIMPPQLWSQICAFGQYKSCAKFALELYEQGHPVRSILLSLIDWSHRTCTDEQIYVLAPMMSRMEKQMVVCENTSMLLLEIVVTVWETCSDKCPKSKSTRK